MSRPDPYDQDYPASIPSHTHRPRSTERDPYSSLGRGAAQGYAGITGSMARSLAMQQDHYPREYPSFPIPLPEPQGPNRHNPTSSQPTQNPSYLAFNHHQHRASPAPNSHPAGPNPAAYLSNSPNDRDPLFLRQNQQLASVAAAAVPALTSRSTLWWGELEPWMDEEYVKQVCGLMKWDPVNIKVPHPPPDPTTGQQSNNPGYCYITFPSQQHAANVLAQVASGSNGGSLTMPNSSKPFVMNWPQSVNSISPMASSFPTSPGAPHNNSVSVAAAAAAAAAAAQPFPKEYSIFVGDLAPETSNSDLVAVFRNPVLGLRNDREPKFIRPFLSCKSAKIMLDPVTGVSRGYGFVRFTDEADQQRALIEMHGLYCLSRPMRISPATAKYKASTNTPNFDLPQVSFTSSGNTGGADLPGTSVTVALPLPVTTQAKSVSAPIAAGGPPLSLNSNVASMGGGSHSNNSLSSGTGSSTSIATSAFGAGTSTEEIMQNDYLRSLAQQYSMLDTSPFKMASTTPSYLHEMQMRQVLQQQAEDPAPRYVINEESWKHHAQARAILGNLIGPNGEQLTSTDPYNTTVFVGGLSPLISEDTLRTFFAPFGDIHYVKVPVGKHCGFVQFVRKADAEKAIEKMQGFPIGGSRIRLSWGRSQYKAAQAAAQAAQSAALQPTAYVPPPVPVMQQPTLTQEQAMALLQKFTQQGYFQGLGAQAPPSHDASDIENALLNTGFANIKQQQHQQQHHLQHQQQAQQQQQQQQQNEENASNGAVSNNFARPDLHRTQSAFSPFSPDPDNHYESSRRDSYSRVENLPQATKAFTPGFFSLSQAQDLKVNTGANAGTPGSNKVSPTANRTANGGLYGFSESSDPPAPLNRAPGRTEAPISRPSSGNKAQAEAQDDAITDLNGTLASLELDRPWKSPA